MHPSSKKAWGRCAEAQHPEIAGRCGSRRLARGRSFSFEFRPVRTGRWLLNTPIIVQYLGFESKTLLREYTFSVREPPGALREYILTIANEAFVSHKVRYQDAPSICLLRLNRELAAAANQPLTTLFSVTDVELADYLVATTPKVAPTFQMRRKD